MERKIYPYRARIASGFRGWVYLSKKPRKDFCLSLCAVQPAGSPMPRWNSNLKPMKLKDVQRNPYYRA